MPEGSNRERDLVLAPNEFAFISDQTKGNINVYVGSYKTSLANTDQPVFFNYANKRFERCNLEQAIQLFAIAPEGWYLVMKNPAKDNVHPKNSTVNNLCDLEVGKKVNAPGPISFALWPGQMVKVIQGHHLRSNQYLVVRVYDEEAAKKNWQKAVVKPQNPGAAAEEVSQEITSADLTMGKQLVIKGTDVSFYIPPTGVEVATTEEGFFVREAITLERLEYCILLDENGNKRYIKGPDVVFPNPTETFVEKHGSRKFRAIELNEISGLYIKVIAPYSEGGKEYKVGDELFLTGKDQMIYFPRPEHAIIKYGDQEIHFAVAIPAGEGRYVLNRLSGKITLKNGPSMFLPDPRYEVVVRRVIDPKVCELWFPGNTEALEYNRSLKLMAAGKAQEPYVADGEVRRMHAAPPAPKKAEAAAVEGFAGDDFSRRSNFTPPRTITLDTKYEGAISISVWTGYSVLVVNKAGNRKVVAGPQTYLLEYDESLEALELSTGTPKSTDKTLKTSYLRVLHNKISDVVEAETSDLVRVRILVSYRVNFEGSTDSWFNVENYVKFLTDHMRSLISNRIKEMTIESFYARAINLVRDMVLGVASPDGKRPGRLFPENGMRIYDVEVLDVKIGDAGIEKLLVEAQHSVVQQNLEVSAQKRQLEYVRQSEVVKQQMSQSKATTKTLEIDLQTDEVKRQLLLNLAKIDSEVEGRKKTLEAKFAEQELLSNVDEAELARRKAAADLELSVAHRRLEQQLEVLKAEVKAVVDKAGAVSPDLIAALQAFSDRALAERMAESMAPLAILGGKSIAEVFATLLQGTPLEAVLKRKQVVAPAAHPASPAPSAK